MIPRKLRVLHVAPQPPPIGGMVTYITGLLNSDTFKELDALVVRQDYLGKERFRGTRRVIINFLNSAILTLKFLYQIIRWKPDIVHVQANSGFGFFEKTWIIWLGNLLGKKTILHVHGGNFRNFYSQASPIIKRFIKKSACLSDILLTSSPQMKETFLLVGVPGNQIVYFDNAVNLPDIEKKYISGTGVTILFFTRVVLAKGIIELIDAAINLRKSGLPVILRIVGAEDFETDQVKTYLNNNGSVEYIKYIGPVSEEQKAKELSIADIYAFPTHVEDQSYAVLEAMSYGLPCVASNVGGIPSQIFDGENGLLCQPKDSESLYSALRKLVCETDLRIRLGKAARQSIIENFTWSSRSKDMIALYNQVMEIGLPE